ncbi:MAG: SDR family NAD(P)-dependent oxidoreductase [Pseudomonadota bacterium]
MNAVVFGASGGIGGALIENLIDGGAYEKVFGVSRSGAAPAGCHSLAAPSYDDDALSGIASEISQTGPLTLCICAIGVLSNVQGLKPERSYKQQARPAFEQVFDANVITPALIAKHMLPVMARDQRAVFATLSARVGSISDNRLGGWHAYRASKAALNMLIKNYAIEEARRNRDLIIVGLHPGTVDTPLSEPFQKNVPLAQLFSPAKSAAHLMEVVDNLSPDASGKIFDWAGREIPP